MGHRRNSREHASGGRDRLDPGGTVGNQKPPLITEVSTQPEHHSRLRNSQSCEEEVEVVEQESRVQGEEEENDDVEDEDEDIVDTVIALLSSILCFGRSLRSVEEEGIIRRFLTPLQTIARYGDVERRRSWVRRKGVGAVGRTTQDEVEDGNVMGGEDGSGGDSRAASDLCLMILTRGMKGLENVVEQSSRAGGNEKNIDAVCVGSECWVRKVWSEQERHLRDPSPAVRAWAIRNVTVSWREAGEVSVG